MNYIIAAILFALIFFSYATVKNLVKSVFNGSGTLYNINSYAWFYGLVIINLIVILFVFYYSKYRMLYTPGDLGPKGYKGYNGENADNCVIYQNC
tara:strand:+ start:287 stop:571 length:285 start_codon:yes stop_codon:yes gene_type:complete